jgi:hypothetical protein
MASPIRVQPDFSGAMKRDFSRTDLPSDSLWNLIDFLPEVLAAPLRKRGGYEYASQDIASVTASAAYIIAGITAPFSDGKSILAFDEDGRVYEVESTTGTENIGAALTTRSPVFYSDKVIVPDSAGTTAPKKITRSGGTHTIANLGGTPPAGKYALIYKDVPWLAAPAASSDRIFFGTAGNPEDTWDLVNKYLDASYPITGMAALSNAVFIFSLERTARVRGSIPPPDTDFIVDDPVFEVGCTDNRSIANYRDKVIWANAQGLFISDGTAMDDLTSICGMKKWWLDVMHGTEGFATGSTYDPASWSIVGAAFRDYYFFSIMNGSTKVDAGVIDLKRYTWMRLKNIDAVSMWTQPFPEEVYWGRRGAARVAKTSSLFTPAAGNKADADGTAVEPQLETGFYAYDGKLKTFRTLFVDYDIRDAATDNPILTVSYIDSPEEASYTALTPTMAEVLALTKEHFPLNLPAYGIAFKIVQSNNSSDTRLYGMDLHANPREGNR